MPARPLNAIVFGSTGAVGSEVVRQCVADPRVGRVTAVTRRPLAIGSDKISTVLCSDFLNLEPIAEHLAGQDVCFYCLGVSQLQVKDPTLYREITRDYTLAAARALLERSPDHLFHFLSGGGADPSGGSKVMFAKVKGETERDLTELPMPKLVIWRPGYINPMVPREESAPLYDRILRPLYPLIRRLSSRLATDTIEVAAAMLQATFEGRTGGVVHNPEIREIAGRSR